MRLAGQERRMLVSTARWAGTDYRVLRPAHPIAHGFLSESRFGADLSVDRAASVDFAFAWWLAARSPHSIVHLPLRASTTRCDEEPDGRRLDLVLLHHSQGFPASRWKRLRARLRPPAAHKVTLPPRPFRPVRRAEHERRHHREFRDHLRWEIAADTLFVTGSRHAFELEGDEVRALVEESPSRLAEDPGAHCCAEIGLGTWSPYPRRNPMALLHVECCTTHSAPAGGHLTSSPAERPALATSR